jgi:hypothetical protein
MKEIAFTFNELPTRNLIIPALKSKSVYILNEFGGEKNNLKRLDIDIGSIRDAVRYSTINFDLKKQRFDVYDYLKNEKISYFNCSIEDKLQTVITR